MPTDQPEPEPASDDEVFAAVRNLKQAKDDNERWAAAEELAKMRREGRA
ncbi:hypothetical protein [Kitasatospora aureofaciens]|nr:hypothetical protein [Kitasatospora aureofaciens]